MNWKTCAACLFLALAATACEREPEQELVWQKMEAPVATKKVESRCEAPVSKSLRLLDGETLVWERSNEELMALARELPLEKLRGKRVITLASLLEGRVAPKGIEIVPCAGRIIRIAAEDLASEPPRWGLKRAGRGFFKLLNLHNLEHGGGNADPAKNLLAIRILPPKAAQ